MKKITFKDFKDKMKEKTSTILNREKIYNDIYDAKYVWLSTFLACVWIFVVFKSTHWYFKIPAAIFGAFDFWCILRKTLDAKCVQDGNFYIVLKRPGIDNLKIIFDDHEVFVKGLMLPGNVDTTHDIYIVFIKDIPVYYYSTKQYALSEDLSNMVITNNSGPIE